MGEPAQRAPTTIASNLELMGDLPVSDPFRCRETARRFGIGIANEENGLAFVLDHPHGEIVGGCVLGHHAGSEHKDAPAAEFHIFGLTLFQHHKIQFLVQLHAGVLAMRAVRFEVVDFREHPAEAANVNGLFLQPPFAHQQRQQGEDLLRAPQGERRDEHATFAFEGALDRSGEAFNFLLAREAARRGAVAARGFHDEHVRAHILETRAAQDGLVVETNVAGVEQSFLPPAQKNSRRAQRVAGVEKFERRRAETGARLVEGGPFNLPIVPEALKEGRDVVHFIVRVERIFLDPEFRALTGHHVD